MSDETQFLEMIRASKDVTIRLVYADWLDERADPRGELIRIEEEMRRLPAYSDEYWQLKHRRNELRSGVSTEWLEQMSYGTDCHPLFTHGIPDDWKNRWRLIREFMERWHKRPMADVGGRSYEIQKTENRLGRTLPPSLREWVAFAFDVRIGTAYHGVLRDGYQMREIEGHSAISLLLQCEGDYHWSVRHEDFQLLDPPVSGFHWDFENQSEDFVPDERNPIHDSVTQFVFEYAIGYTQGQGGGFDVEVPDRKKLIHELTVNFPVQSRLGETIIFEADDIMARFVPLTEFSDGRLSVELAKPMPLEKIPAFLWNYTQNGGGFHGMFANEKARRDMLDSL